MVLGFETLNPKPSRLGVPRLKGWAHFLLESGHEARILGSILEVQFFGPGALEILGLRFRGWVLGVQACGNRGFAV